MQSAVHGAPSVSRVALATSPTLRAGEEKCAKVLSSSGAAARTGVIDA